MATTSLFEYSTAFRQVSEATKELCRGNGGGTMKPRDPAMYGPHHKCNKCDDPAKYIAKNTHWCPLHWEYDANPALTGKTMEEIDAMRAANVAVNDLKPGHSLMSKPSKDYGKVGF